jgi:undecaprenyl-diphosphatase
MSVLAYVELSDQRLAGRLQSWRPPRWLRVWMLTASRLGDGWLWLGAPLLLALETSRGPSFIGAAALAAAVANTLVVVLKRRFRRRRPAAHSPNPFFALARPELLDFDHFSFPSGHSLNAFAVCSILALAFPPLALAYALLAASVGASRVVLRLHFLSDVLAGALIGVLIGVSSVLLVVG